MRISHYVPTHRLLAAFIVLITSIEGGLLAQVEPTIVSTVPPNFATGVSPAGAVVFTFSEPMDVDETTADFLDSTTFMSLPTTAVWSLGNTVLTCTPTPAFPANRLIVWSVFGQNVNTDPLGGNTSGFFTTSGTGGGSGTNRITEFSVGKVHVYRQTSVATPTLDTNTPYGFVATTTLASNRTANAVTLTLPNATVSNVMQNPFVPEHFLLVFDTTNQATLNSTFPDGGYTFTVASTPGLQATLNLPANLPQPGVPHISNFPASQSVNAAQPFILSWDPFQGGNVDGYIYVTIGDAFASPQPGESGALSGTATSITIPAGTLTPGTTYDSAIGFYRANVNTNNSDYSTVVFRATFTRFDLTTGGGATSPLILTNATSVGGIFSFDVTSAPGQIFSIEYSSTMLSGQWQTLVNTNSPTGRLRIIDPHSATNSHLFYRARNGL